MIRFLALLALLSAAACAPPPITIPEEPPHIVGRQIGGDVVSYYRTRQEMIERGLETIFPEDLASAAVVLSTIPNGCLQPEARIGFHRPVVDVSELRELGALASFVIPGAAGSLQLAEEYGDELAILLIATAFSGEARLLWLTEWSLVPPEEILWIPATDFVALESGARLCPST